MAGRGRGRRYNGSGDELGDGYGNLEGQRDGLGAGWRQWSRVWTDRMGRDGGRRRRWGRSDDSDSDGRVDGVALLQSKRLGVNEGSVGHGKDMGQ